LNKCSLSLSLSLFSVICKLQITNINLHSSRPYSNDGSVAISGPFELRTFCRQNKRFDDFTETTSAGKRLLSPLVHGWLAIKPDVNPFAALSHPLLLVPAQRRSDFVRYSELRQGDSADRGHSAASPEVREQRRAKESKRWRGASVTNLCKHVARHSHFYSKDSLSTDGQDDSLFTSGGESAHIPRRLDCRRHPPPPTTALVSRYRSVHHHLPTRSLPVAFFHLHTVRRISPSEDRWTRISCLNLFAFNPIDYYY
jgi:hypothetical protein